MKMCILNVRFLTHMAPHKLTAEVRFLAVHPTNHFAKKAVVHSGAVR